MIWITAQKLNKHHNNIKSYITMVALLVDCNADYQFQFEQHNFQELHKYKYN